MKRKLAELINIIFGFRKFLLMLVVAIIGVVFRIKGLINGAEMVDLIKTVAIAFMGANGVEHIMTVVKDYVAAKNGQPATGEATGAVADTDESNDEEDVT